MTNLIIIRGLPGSGKSTLARELMSSMNIKNHFEADQFFEQNGEYNFNPALLHKAHQTCFENTQNALVNNEAVDRDWETHV